MYKRVTKMLDEKQEQIDSLVVSLLAIKGLLGPGGDYSVCCTDRTKKLDIGDQLLIGTVF